MEGLTLQEKYLQLLEIKTMLEEVSGGEQGYNRIIDSFEVFGHAMGHPLEVLCFSKMSKKLCKMVKWYETDYPFELANLGVALNLDSLFDGKS